MLFKVFGDMKQIKKKNDGQKKDANEYFFFEFLKDEMEKKISNFCFV